MNIKETRRNLAKYSPDILTAWASTIMPPEDFARYPSTGNDLASKVQFLLEWAERKRKEAELIAFIDERTRRLRRLLIEGFSESDLYQFCYDDPQFKDVALNLGMGKGKMAYANSLIEECDQNPSKYQVLFAWAKAENPARYMEIMWDW